MILDRSAGLDPRNERKQIAKTQEEITSALNRVAHNTDPRNQERSSGSNTGRFKDQGVRSMSMMRRFQKEQEEQAFRAKEEEKKRQLMSSRSRPESTEMKIINFRDGLVIPITDHMDYHLKERMNFDLRLHRQKIFQLRMIDRKVQALIPKGGKTLGQRMREAFNDFMVAPIINTFKFIGKNILMPVVSKIGSSFYNVFKDSLFGLGKKKRDEVKAIDEQTQFMREGFIDRDRNLWEKLTQQGLLGTAKKGIAGMITGQSEKTARQAEKRKFQGKELSKVEQKALKKQKENINLFKAGGGKEEEQRKERNNLLRDIDDTMHIGFENTVRSILTGRDQVKRVIADGFARLMGVEEKIAYETELANSPFHMSHSDEQMIDALRVGTKTIRDGFEKSEQAKQDKEDEKRRSRGGLLGLTALSVAWLGKKIYGWLKSGVTYAGPLLMKTLKTRAIPFITTGVAGVFSAGIASALSGVGSIGLAATVGWGIGSIINKGINWADKHYGTDIGNDIGKFVANIMEGGIWFLGKKTLGILKFWFNEIASGIDSLLSEVPVIGRFFDGSSSGGNSNTPSYSTDPRGRMGMGHESINKGNLDDMSKGVEQSNNELKQWLKKQTEESKSANEQLNEYMEEQLKILNQINGNSAATAANSGGNTEEKVFLRKDQQFTFEGNPL